MAFKAVDTRNWMNEETRNALSVIRGNEAVKKRATVILLASAKAGGQPIEAVFKDERACSESTWYQKWQYLDTIQAALDVCEAAALSFVDDETARIEARALQQRRRALAEGSLDAIEGLRMTALSGTDRADYRTEASRVLLTLADEELAARLAASGDPSLPVNVSEPVDINVPKLDELLMKALYDERDDERDDEMAGDESPGVGDGGEAADFSPDAGLSAA
jgi:hypothetical protein